jgi:positive regulator of sigma E activity
MKHALWGEQRTDRGIIARRARRGVVVVLDKSCISSGACGSCAGCGVRERPLPRVHVPLRNPEQFSAGQRVLLSRFALNEAAAAACAFGIPILCALLAGFWWYARFAGDDRGALVALGALGAGFIAVAAADRLIQALHPPRILDDASRE